MKKVQRFSVITMALVMLFALLPVLPSAQAITYGDWSYEVDNAGNATITKYNGTAAVVTIPSAFGANPVTKIGKSAFLISFGSNTTMVSVTIPNGVTSIGENAFLRCRALKSLTLPDSVTTIGESAFNDCTALTSIKMSKNIETINAYAFENCSSLTSINIPNGTALVAQRAFKGCKSLTSVSIGSGKIHDGAFTNCTALKSVTLGEGVTELGGQKDSFFPISDGVFQGCTSLTSIILPDSLTMIGKNTFYGCSALKVAYIPESVVFVDDSAFYGCAAVTIYCKEGSAAHTFAKNGKIPFSFNPPPTPYTVTFNKNASNAKGSMAAQDYMTGAAQKLNANSFTRKGYVFAGWATSKTGKVVHKNKASVKDLTTKSNITLYAVWTAVKAPAKAVTSLALKSAKTKQLTVDFKAVSDADGYRIQYSTNSNFSGTQTKYTTKASYTLTGLKAGTRYYVRVTAYKVDSEKNKIYSTKNATKNSVTK